MDAQEMVKLLEGSILPLMADMIKAMGENSNRFERHIKSIDSKMQTINQSPNIEDNKELKEELTAEIRDLSKMVESTTAKETGQEEAFKIFTKTINRFGEKLTDLINTNNKLIDHQERQVNKIDELIYAFEENTARLDHLTLNVQDYTREREDDEEFKSENALYKELTEDTNNVQSLHDVMEKGIQQINGNDEKATNNK